MTVCNMTIEAGARAGLIAPDQKTFDYLRGRPFAPADFDAAVARWRQLPSDAGAKYDRREVFRAEEIQPQVTWGTNPGQVVDVGGCVPDPADFANATDQKSTAAPCNTWASRPVRRSPNWPSIVCSSAPAPMGGSRTCAPRPPWCMGIAWLPA